MYIQNSQDFPAQVIDSRVLFRRAREPEFEILQPLLVQFSTRLRSRTVADSFAISCLSLSLVSSENLGMKRV